MTIPTPMNPMPPEEYAKVTGFDGKWRDTWWKQDFLELIVRRLELRGTQTLLDVGCGVGHWGRTLSKVLPHSKIVGVDFEREFVSQATLQAKAFGLKDFDYQTAPAESLPFEDHRFDLVTCQTLLIHVQDPRRVIQEMKRVLKPGGTLLLVEPNNLITYFNQILVEPRPKWEHVLKLIDFYHTCLQGKRELGMGDSSVGERLPGELAKCGLKQVRVCINENCPALTPPYDSEHQTIELPFLRGILEKELWLGFGPKSNSLRFYLAAGGKESDFESLWDMAMEQQAGILKEILNGTFSGSRGTLLYLISGKKL